MNRFVRYAMINHRQLNSRNLLERLGSASRASQSSVVTNEVKCRSDEPPVNQAAQTSEIKFDNAKATYGSKTAPELIRALLVLKLTSYRFLIVNNMKIIEWCQSVLGDKLFRKFMRLTFFGHFIAGENHQEILPKIERLIKADCTRDEKRWLNESVRPIIGHDLEEEDHDKFLCQNVDNDFKNHNVQIKTEFRDWYHGLVKSTIDCLKNVDEKSMIAIKLTSLCSSLILRKLTIILEPIPGKRDKRYELMSITDLLDKEEAKFTSQELKIMKQSLVLLSDIIKSAVDNKIGILVDAEHSYFQPAIDRLTMDLMRKYNKSYPFVFNTYQNYLKSANATILSHLDESRKFDFCFGAKLVRGAYMNSERNLAMQYNYPDPINENYDKTSEMIHGNINLLMEEMEKLDRDSNKISIVVASHNEDTIRLGVKGLKTRQLNPKSIALAQLYSMSDHITFTLGQAGLPAYKLMAFGPVDKILPFLSRRAAENHSVLEKTKKERKLIRSEILQRMKFV